MKEIPLNAMHKGDWSLNLEEEYGPGEEAEMLHSSIEAVTQTRPEHYVNIITPGEMGHPVEWFITRLERALAERELSVERVVYVGECGCGGYITRVYR